MMRLVWAEIRLWWMALIAPFWHFDEKRWQP